MEAIIDFISYIDLLLLSGLILIWFTITNIIIGWIRKPK